MCQSVFKFITHLLYCWRPGEGTGPPGPCQSTDSSWEPNQGPVGSSKHPYRTLSLQRGSLHIFHVCQRWNTLLCEEPAPNVVLTVFFLKNHLVFMLFRIYWIALCVLIYILISQSRCIYNFMEILELSSLGLFCCLLAFPAAVAGAAGFPIALLTHWLISLMGFLVY